MKLFIKDNIIVLNKQETKNKSVIVVCQRAQCRTIHKRKDC